ncbi:septum formation family protein [Actinomyces bowdenii]|uniref:Septum formation family protein n=1 Tax=Actinomyces bowdenii TaxID=131109 RepID=A0A853EL79_9ACTO|nr:septum formation family protein [Actinomyces bowdenii]MBF0696668.1 septum formation family protein [Actinomyces bowdenii]NYS68841.1 septum formation family protein [Actinomyces bowdenii]
MRKLKPLLIIPTAAILAAGMTGCSVIQSLTGGTNSTDISVGQCLKDLGTSSQEVSQVPVVDCSEPHLYEVYAETELSGDQLPDQATMDSEAESACLGTGYSDYVGVAFEESEYGTTYLTPSQDTWDAGDRKISCLITSADGSEMTGSVKGSAK